MNLENSVIHPANMTLGLDNPSSTRDSLAKYNAAQIPKSSPQLGGGDQPRKGGGADVFELFGV
jgi:hypothetical protein